jgi:hypothetical protein
MLNTFRVKFLYFFQEILVFRVSSLHFRAKILASVIACNENYSEEDIKILEEVSKQIYPKDENRASILEAVTINYVNSVLNKKNGFNLDKLIININNLVSKTPRFKDKISTDLLVMFTVCCKDSKSSCIQYRVLEFLENLKNDK